MHYLDYWKTIIRYDPDSPTRLVKIKSGKVVGRKVKNNAKHGGASYSWWAYDWGKVTGKTKESLSKLVYSLYHDISIPDSLYVRHLDYNIDNFDPDNLALYPKRRKQVISRKCNIKAYTEFKNIILSPNNPDYFKHPSEWKDAEALRRLELEKEHRISGISKSPKHCIKTKFK